MKMLTSGYSSAGNTRLSATKLKELSSPELVEWVMNNYLSTSLLTADQPYEYERYFGPDLMSRNEQQLVKLAQAQEALLSNVEKSPLGIRCLTDSQHAFAFGTCWSRELSLFREQMKRAALEQSISLDDIAPGDFSSSVPVPSPRTKAPAHRPMFPVKMQQRPTQRVQPPLQQQRLAERRQQLQQNQKAAHMPMEKRRTGPLTEEEKQQFIKEQRKGSDAYLRKSLQPGQPAKRPADVSENRLIELLHHHAPPPPKMARHADNTTARQVLTNRQPVNVQRNHSAVPQNPSGYRTQPAAPNPANGHHTTGYQTASVRLAPPPHARILSPPLSDDGNRVSPLLGELSPVYGMRPISTMYTSTAAEDVDPELPQDVLASEPVAYSPEANTRLPSMNDTFGAGSAHTRQC